MFELCSFISTIIFAIPVALSLGRHCGLHRWRDLCNVCAKFARTFAAPIEINDIEWLAEVLERAA